MVHIILPLVILTDNSKDASISFTCNAKTMFLNSDDCK